MYATNNVRSCEARKAVKVELLLRIDSRAVVFNLFYISYPFIEQDYQIYPQYTQWWSFIENINKLL